MVKLGPGLGGGPALRAAGPGDDTVVECTLSEQATSEDTVVVRLGDGNVRLVVDLNNVVSTVYAGSGNDRVNGQEIDGSFGEAGELKAPLASRSIDLCWRFRPL
jgi:hypothetical protein